jgi:hypothetical protein
MFANITERWELTNGMRNLTEIYSEAYKLLKS